LADGKMVVEYPAGHTLLESESRVVLRVGPSGDRIALVEYRIPSYPEGRIEVMDLNGTRQSLTDRYASISSIAWSPDGKEIWFTASSTLLSPRTLMAVNLDGKVRIVRESPVPIRIHDCAADGRVLLSIETFHHRIAGMNESHGRELDLSWFEGSDQPSISADGRWLLSTVIGEAGKGKNRVYLRDDQHGTAVRLGEGNALALSPDGQWALVGTGPLQSDLELLPTGPGEPRRLDNGELSVITAGFWFADGKRLLLVGHEAGHTPRAWILDISGGTPQAVTDEGVLTACPPSPDGKWVAAFSRERKAFLAPVAGGEARELDALPAGYLPVGWGNNGGNLFVRELNEVSRLDGYVTTAAPARIERFDLDTRRLTPWRELAPGEPAGRSHVDNVSIAPDGSSYAYAYATFSSVLYQVEGLH
jgi:Tol biopolymer transport system component